VIPFCPKCGYGFHAARQIGAPIPSHVYRPAGTVCSNTECRRTDEHMRFTCPQCQYVWCENVIGTPPVERVTKASPGLLRRVFKR
jgi:hypothetical protein